MPCDGITVLEAQLARRDAQKDTVLDMLKDAARLGVCQIVQQVVEKDVVKIACVINKIQIQIAVYPGGRVTAITRNGTFDQGKKVLEQAVIQALQAKGVKLDNVKFEMHTHTHQAPRLAYATAQQGR